MVAIYQPSETIHIGRQPRGVRLAGGGLAPFDFNAALATFTAGMAKRSAPGPFSAAPIVQGDANNLSSLVDDVLYFGRGTQISGNFYANADTRQGSVVLWWTPEYSHDALSGNVDHEVIWVNSTCRLVYEYDNNRFAFTVGASVLNVANSIAAGTTYCLIMRWDCGNTLDGTNYLSLSINDTHTFGVTSAPTAAAPDSVILIGNSSGTNVASSAIIEGLTIYRRPLFDGAYGIDVGNGDEINLIYNGGTGKDPCEITGSWDVCFCLPTNSTAGALVTGTGEAWSHPHGSNLTVDGYCQTTYASAQWATAGTPSSGPSDALTADKIFAWGYKWTADADGEGIAQQRTGQTAGQNYVMRLIAHSSTADPIRVVIRDNTNSADIVSYEFGGGSSRTAPGVAIITWELPTVARNGVGADCTAYVVSIQATAASQTIVMHQCEVQVNLVDNPSMETGSGNPWIPSGWTNNGLGSGHSLQEASIVHSGASAFEYASGATAGIYRTPTLILNNFYGIGFWSYGDGTSPLRFRAWLPSYGVKHASSADNYRYSDVAASWKHNPSVYRCLTTNFQHALDAYSSPAPTGARYIDDIYILSLTAVSLTVTPASLANSTESTGIRVDGLDTLTQPITNLTATSGKVRFRYTPRHSAADQGKFGLSTTYPRVLQIWGNSNNNILLYWSNVSALTLYVISNGSDGEATWNTAGAIVAGTTYAVEIEYNASQITLKVDGVLRITATPGAGINFVTIPTTMYWGHNNVNVGQADATFAAPA